MKQNDSPHDNINGSLLNWRQGDCVIGPQNFFFAFNPRHPVSKPAIDAAAELEQDSDPIAVVPVKGLVVLTQTCDLVRNVEKKPYVDVAPLIEVTLDQLAAIQSRTMPGLAEIPSLRDQRLVADLDRVMTIEKPALTQCERTPGCTSEEERKFFSEALSRKWARPALPDKFTGIFRPLQERWKEKHGKNSPEGRLLRAFREIRVQPSPSWDAEKVSVRIWFIFDSPSSKDSDFGISVEEQIEKWISMIKTTGTPFQFDGWSGTYGGMGADDYVVSYKLDYDHLS